MAQHWICIFFICTLIAIVACNNEAGTCRTKDCESSVVAPLIDSQDAPLVARLDMSKANQRINQLITDSIRTKMNNFTETKLEEVLKFLNLEEKLKDYMNEVRRNLTTFISEDIERVMKQKIEARVDLRRKDEIALPMCIGINKIYGRVEAVRRNCVGKETCANVCKALDIRLTCFYAVHIYNKVIENTSSAHWYKGGCNGQYCGPNYCCCGR